MPNRRPSAAPAALAAVLVVAAGASASCDRSTGEDETAGAPPSTVQEGPVAATAVVPGDCLNGIVIGASERAEIDAAQVVSCDRAHSLEVFATFRLDPGDFDQDDPAAYPGPARVVAAADAGCTDRIAQLVDDPDRYGLIALWPSPTSWASGDRAVACAVFAPDGSPFEGRQL